MSSITDQKCNIVTLILKDLSFEAPKRYEEIDFKSETPSIKQTLTPTITSDESGDFHTVELKVNITASYNDDKDTLFITEVTHVATVDTTGAEELEKNLFINGTTLDILYNNNREVANSLMLKGNFPGYQLAFISHEQNFIMQNQELINKAQADKAA